MEILYLPKFKRQFKKLPKEIKMLAIEKEKLFRKNTTNPVLKTHKLGGQLKSFWAFSINKNCRIIFDYGDNDTIRFYYIGNHDIYYK